jgi:hypothetical protein
MRRERVSDVSKSYWWIVALALVAACGDDDKPKNNGGLIIADEDMAADMAVDQAQTTEDMALDQSQPVEDMALDQAQPVEDMAPDQAQPVEDMEEDIPTFGMDLSQPDGGDGCDEEAVLTREWPLHSAVSQGAVTVTSENGVFTATIDAAAGGSQQARNNPFVYLDLDNGGVKVAVSDKDAFGSKAWELAFRRTAIRTNSVQSGPGAVLVSKELETTFEAEVAAPALTDASAWRTDTTVDEQCMVQLDPIGVPMTAINFLNLFNPSGSRSWYTYDANGVNVTPGDIYFVKSADSDTIYKLEIQAWVSGVYTIRWAPLP